MAAWHSDTGLTDFLRPFWAGDPLDTSHTTQKQRNQVTLTLQLQVANSLWSSNFKQLLITAANVVWRIKWKPIVDGDALSYWILPPGEWRGSGEGEDSRVPWLQTKTQTDGAQRYKNIMEYPNIVGEMKDIPMVAKFPHKKWWHFLQWEKRWEIIGWNWAPQLETSPREDEKYSGFDFRWHVIIFYPSGLYVGYTVYNYIYTYWICMSIYVYIYGTYMWIIYIWIISHLPTGMHRVKALFCDAEMLLHKVFGLDPAGMLCARAGRAEAGEGTVGFSMRKAGTMKLI